MNSCSTFTKFGAGFPFSFGFALRRSCMFCWRAVFFAWPIMTSFTTLVEADRKGGKTKFADRRYH